MALNIHIIDNTKEIIRAKNAAIARALEKIGLLCENHTKSNITSDGLVKTGALRNSITHTVEGDAAVIGSSLEYAVFHEYGTGIHAEGGGGRKDPWVYVDDEGGHRTRGVRPKHFLKRGVNDHWQEYKRIGEQELMNG